MEVRTHRGPRPRQRRPLPTRHTCHNRGTAAGSAPCPDVAGLPTTVFRPGAWLGHRVPSATAAPGPVWAVPASQTPWSATLTVSRAPGQAFCRRHLRFGLSDSSSWSWGSRGFGRRGAGGECRRHHGTPGHVQPTGPVTGDATSRALSSPFRPVPQEGRHRHRARHGHIRAGGRLPALGAG